MVNEINDILLMVPLLVAVHCQQALRNIAKQLFLLVTTELTETAIS